MDDNYCDDQNNDFKCNYDHGDCCLPGVNTMYCTECLCKSNEPEYPSSFGPKPTFSPLPPGQPQIAPPYYGGAMNYAAPP